MSRDIKDLHPCLQRAYHELIRRCELEGIRKVGVSCTYRSKEEQDELYKKGRVTKGSIVTNSKGGQSYHNYRLAFDVFKNIKGQEYTDSLFFKKVATIWKNMGGDAGYFWTNFIDKPHLQYTGGLTIGDLQRGKKLPNDVKMKWEIKKEVPLDDIKQTVELAKRKNINIVHNYWNKVIKGLEPVNTEFYSNLKFKVYGQNYRTLATLNIRAIPNIQGKKIGTYPKSTLINVLEYKGEWGKTDRGYVHLNYCGVCDD